MKKILLQIILLVAIGALVWWLYSLFNTPLEFERMRKEREAKVVERLKDIRTAQRAYRNKYLKFTPSFDSLIAFVKYDSLTFEHAIGSADDSLAVAQGRVSVEKFQVAVKDTIQFISPEVLQDVNNLRYIPGSVEATGSMQQFVMDTASIETESKVVVPVFEAFAQYPTFLGDLDKQELINFRDYQINTLSRADGLKVGSLTATTNEAGNWDGE
ncbi:hypothetical protein [Millionella massiliensis]|uniref:hypothetical protein n=1 Tax=Millionella massiliensis TaxID=1871023 RepID=UPI0008D91EE8|nr:hypothetical protein [Millionella massiliensis]